MSRFVKRVGKAKVQTAAMSDKLSTLSSRILTVGAAYAGFRIAKDIINTAAKFEQQMSDVSTLIAGDATEAIDELSDGIKKLMKEVPKSAEELGASAYAIFSAGITDTSEALEVLKASGELAVAGLGTTEEATTLMTLAMNNFRDSGLSAAEMSDILFKTVKNGITTVSDLSRSFGLVAPLAVEAGISIQELQAMTGALTQVNKSASISQNQLKASLVSLGKPTEAAMKLFRKLDVETFAGLIKKTGSYMEAIEAMRGATEGNSKAWNDAIGSGEALSAVNALLGVQMDSVTLSMYDMTDGANAITEAFEKQKKTFASTYQLFINEIDRAKIAIGDRLLPALTDIMKATMDVGDEFSRTTTGTIADMKDLAGTIASTVGKSIEGLIELMRVLNAQTAIWKALFEPAVYAAKSFGTGIKTITTGLEATGDVLGGVVGEFFAGEGMGWQSSLQGITEARDRIFGLSDAIYGATEEGQRLAVGIGKVATASKKIIEDTKKTPEESPPAPPAPGVPGAVGKTTADESEKTAEKIEDAQRKIRESLQKTQNEFYGLRLSGVDSLTDLASAHNEAMAKMKAKADELTATLGELETAYKIQVAGFDKTAAERVIAQEDLIASLKKEISEKVAAGDDTSELRKRLEREKSALRAFLKENTDLNEEIAEARRRAGLVDFQRFADDLELRREKAAEDFAKKKSRIEEEIAALEEQRKREDAIYEAKRAGIEKINEAIKNNWSNILGEMEKRTERFADLAQAKLESIKKAFEAMRDLTGGVASGAASEYLPPGSSELFSAPPAAASRSVNINIDLGGVNVNQAEDIDTLIFRLKSELARAAELINKNASPTPTI